MLPNKSYNQPMACSQVSSGQELDPECGGIPQAEAGEGFDRALHQKMAPSVGTTYNDAEQTTQIHQIPVPGPVDFSPTMKKLVSNAAPRNAYIVEEK